MPARGGLGAGRSGQGRDADRGNAAAGKKPMPDLPSPYTPNYTRGAVPPASGQPPDLAYGAYQRGQYVTAFREATKRIEANPKDAAAMTLLGELYNQGLGVKQNPVKAAEWYRLAAAQNDAAAMSSLGPDGPRRPRDGRRIRRPDAAGWSRRPAHGSPTAAYNLGLILIGRARPPTRPRRPRSSARPRMPRSAPRSTIWACSIFRVAACRRTRSRRRSGSGAAPITAISPARSSTRSCCSTAPASPRTSARPPATSCTPPRAATRSRRTASRGSTRSAAASPKNPVEAAAWNLAAAGQGLSDAWLDQTLSGLSADERTRAERLANERIEQR